VVTKEERFPVFHLVFEGNETDITTVGRALSRLKKEFSITDCLLIFDRGMVSEDNIGELDGSEYDFICGLKKKKVVKAVLREVEVAELSNEQNFVKDLEEGYSLFAADRVRELYQREKSVVSKVKVIVKGVSTYFKCTYSSEEGRITIDFDRRNDKIADAEMLDGKYALMSTRIINFSWILYGRSIKPLAMHLGLKILIYGYP
jgi:transposase